MEENTPDHITRKKEQWDKIKKKYSHLKDYCTIDLKGMQENTQYFHPIFRIDEYTYISSQGDSGNNYIYALNFTTKDPETTDTFTVEIYDELLTPIIIGYHTNKEQVLLALTTLSKVRNHITQLNIYVTDYITNILIGNSIKDVTREFIQELSATEKIISFMQKTPL